MFDMDYSRVRWLFCCGMFGTAVGFLIGRICDAMLCLLE